MTVDFEAERERAHRLLLAGDYGCRAGRKQHPPGVLCLVDCTACRDRYEALTLVVSRVDAYASGVDKHRSDVSQVIADAQKYVYRLLDQTGPGIPTWMCPCGHWSTDHAWRPPAEVGPYRFKYDRRDPKTRCSHDGCGCVQITVPTRDED